MQLEQAEAPATDEYLPEEHLSHAVAPVLDW